MKISPSQKRDKEFLEMLLETQQIAIRNGFMDQAEALNEDIQRLRFQISTHDYLSEDKSWYRVEEIISSHKAHERSSDSPVAR